MNIVRAARAARPRVRLRWLAAAAVVLAACGGGSDVERSIASAQDAELVQLPSTMVRDLHADADVALGSLLPSDRPVLLWFWAPH